MTHSVYIVCPGCAESIDVDFCKDNDQRTVKCDCCETRIGVNFSIEVFEIENPFAVEDRREAV